MAHAYSSDRPARGTLRSRYLRHRQTQNLGIALRSCRGRIDLLDALEPDDLTALPREFVARLQAGQMPRMTATNSIAAE